MVQILVEHGVDFNEEDYDSAYQAASTEGYENVVQILREHEAKIRSREKYHGTAFQTKTSQDHESDAKYYSTQKST